MSVEQRFEPPLEVDLGDNPGRLTFNTLGEIVEWAQKETEAWGSIQPKQVPKPFQPLVQEQNAAGRSIASLAALCFQGDPPAQAHARQKLESRLHFYGAYRYTHHATSWGQSILRLWPESPARAAAALWAKAQLTAERQGQGPEWVHQAQFHHHTALAIEGILRVIANDAGNSPEQNHEAALVAIEQSLSSSVSNWRTKTVEASGEWDQIRAGIGRGLGAQAQMFAEQLNEAKAAAENFDTETRRKVKELEQLFGEKIRLEAPVQYWKEKVTSHDRGVWLWGIASAVITLLPIILAAHYAPSMYLAFEAMQKGLTAGGVAILLVFAVLYLAFGRQIGRLFVTSLALRNDAAERVVMAQTFLALYQDKKLTDEERKLVLASLFRPYTSGGDSDAPSGLADLVAKAVSPQKS